jgi:hypothetical protein
MRGITAQSNGQRTTSPVLTSKTRAGSLFAGDMPECLPHAGSCSRPLRNAISSPGLAKPPSFLFAGLGGGSVPRALIELELVASPDSASCRPLVPWQYNPPTHERDLFESLLTDKAHYSTT